MDENLTYINKELLLRISEGDEVAFNQLYIVLFPEFSAYAFKIAKSEEAVKEILQESLVRVWLHRDKLQDLENPKRWLLKIIANECFRYLRKYGLQQQLSKKLDAEQSQTNKDELNQTEMELSFRETQRIIQEAVAKLSPRQQTVYQLSREAGLTLPEIAGQLNLSRDYVKNVLMAALQSIRQQLVDAGRFIIILLMLSLLK